jgi:hypothetical protein
MTFTWLNYAFTWKKISNTLHNFQHEQLGSVPATILQFPHMKYNNPPTIYVSLNMHTLSPVPPTSLYTKQIQIYVTWSILTSHKKTVLGFHTFRNCLAPSVSFHTNRLCLEPTCRFATLDARPQLFLKEAEYSLCIPNFGQEEKQRSNTNAYGVRQSALQRFSP